MSCEALLEVVLALVVLAFVLSAARHWIHDRHFRCTHTTEECALSNSEVFERCARREITPQAAAELLLCHHQKTCRSPREGAR